MLDQTDRALRLALRVTLLATERGPDSKAPPMLSADLNEEILETLSEAAVEIANLSGPDNVVCRRLRALQRKLEPQSVTVGELATRIDVSPHDVLDAAVAIGVRPLWHEGQQFRDAAYLKTYLRQRFYDNPTREIEFSLTPDLAGRLADELGTTPEELLGKGDAKSRRLEVGPRKFVSSDSHFPDQAAAGKRREQTG